MGGMSSLTVLTPWALPQRPDVAVENQVPGGILLPCTPYPPGEVPVVNRTQYRLEFPFTQGQQLTVRRIHVKLPVGLGEREFEVSNVKTIETKKYKTTGERDEAANFTGGLPTNTNHITPISQSAPYEQVLGSVTYSPKFGEGLEVITEETVSRSVLPITMMVVVRLFGPDGEMWAESYEVPMHYVTGKMGGGWGQGAIDSYADLNNGIPLDGEKIYSLGLEVLVPTSVKTDPQLGFALEAGTAPGKGAVTFFYDIESTTVGK